MEVDLRGLQRQAAEGADRQHQARRLTRRVAVIGNTGSGKTTVSRRLSARLGVPHVELDSLFWKAGWEESTAHDFAERVTALLDSTDGWVVDGNYRSRVGTRVLDRADLVVWLDLPMRTSAGRVLRRTVKRIRTQEPLWSSNRETWRNAFFRREPLWWFAVKNHVRLRRRLPELLAAYPHIRLRTAQEVDEFLGDDAVG